MVSQNVLRVKCCLANMICLFLKSSSSLSKYIPFKRIKSEAFLLLALKPGNNNSILLNSMILWGIKLSQLKTKWELLSILFLLHHEQRFQSDRPATNCCEFWKYWSSHKWERYLFSDFEPYLKCWDLFGLKIILRFSWQKIISFWDLGLKLFT